MRNGRPNWFGLNRLKNYLKTWRFWQNNQLIFREFQHFPGIVLSAIGVALLATTFEGFGFGFLLTFLQTLVSPTATPLRSGLDWLDVWILGINQPATDRLYRVCGLILLSTWIRAGFNYLTQVYTELAQQTLVDRLRKRLFEQLQELSLSYFNQTNAGELVNTLTSEIGRLQVAFSLVSYLVTKTITVFAYVVLMLSISIPLTVISVILFTIVAIGLARLNQRVRQSSGAVSDASGDFTSRALELISGIRTVQAFAAQNYERQRFYQASSQLLQASMHSVRQLALVRPIAEGLATTILISMIILAVTIFVANRSLETASLLTFLFILFRLVPALHEMNSNRAQLNYFRGSIDNIQAVLCRSDKPYLPEGNLIFSGLHQGIECVDMTFGYTPEQPILRGINLTIPKGKMTALVGESGAGKSTLVDLLARFYDPTEGQILLDGHDARSFVSTSLRQKIAIVSQDTFIFNASVRDNIAYGLETVRDEAIWQAAEQANAAEFIVNLPQQFDTPLGDRGVRLSGGQRQRLAIARALLRNPEILILDEATSALDSVSERLIQKSLQTLMHDRTVIAIAHRLSTIVHADQVVVLAGGKIVEKGSYADLLSLQGSLWRYHQTQHGVGLSSKEI